MHPTRKPAQSFEAHQFELASWMGCTVEQMNATHDPLHRAIADLTGYTSHAMRQAAGEKLTPAEQSLADMEEDGVLALQRYLHHAERTR